MTPALAWQVLLVFAAASLQSVGGGNAVLPQLQLETVVHHHWLTASQFADSFAIAQVAPGPSSLIVTLLGYRIGGLAAALLATAAMIIPSSLVVAVVGRFWIASGTARWHVSARAWHRADRDRTGRVERPDHRAHGRCLGIGVDHYDGCRSSAGLHTDQPGGGCPDRRGSGSWGAGIWVIPNPPHEDSRGGFPDAGVI